MSVTGRGRIGVAVGMRMAVVALVLLGTAPRASSMGAPLLTVGGRGGVPPGLTTED